MDEFKQIINWQGSHKLCKLHKMTSKKGETYWLGEYNKMFKITAWEKQGWKDKPNYLELSLIPVNYEKVNGQQPQPPQPQAQPQTPNFPDIPDDESSQDIPF